MQHMPLRCLSTVPTLTKSLNNNTFMIKSSIAKLFDRCFSSKVLSSSIYHHNRHIPTSKTSVIQRTVTENQLFRATQQGDLKHLILFCVLVPLLKTCSVKCSDVLHG